MIHIDVEKNMLEVNGTKMSLYAELGLLLRDFVKRGILDRKNVDILVEDTFKSDKEIHEEFLEKVGFLRDMFSDILDAGKKFNSEDKNAAMEILKDAMKKEWDK